MIMKTYPFLLVFFLFSLPLFAQTDRNRVAPGAQNQLTALLNKPAAVSPATATPLGGNWFTLELDSHVFTDQASFRQIAAVLLDFENQGQVLNGQKSRLEASIVSRNNNDIIADFVSTTYAPLGLRITTRYRASIRITENTASKLAYEIRQTDSDSNDRMKNLVSLRYAEEVEINGRKYTYIRVYSINDVNASILPGAGNTLQRNSDPANEEALQLIITAARNR
jgi:hypothetical protein